jgi:hypothetical protein
VLDVLFQGGDDSRYRARARNGHARGIEDGVFSDTLEGLGGQTGGNIRQCMHGPCDIETYG